MKRVAIIISTSVLVLTVMFGLLAIMHQRGRAAPELSEAQLVAKIQSNLVSKIVIRPASVATNFSEVQGTFYVTDADGQMLLDHGMPRQLPFRATVNLTPDLEQKLLKGSNVAVVTPNPVVESIRNFVHRSK